MICTAQTGGLNGCHTDENQGATGAEAGHDPRQIDDDEAESHALPLTFTTHLDNLFGEGPRASGAFRFSEGKMPKAPTPQQRAQQALKALPASVRIGPFDFCLIRWPTHQANASARFAEFSALEQVIRISDEIQSPEKVVDSFLHELMHALWWANDLGREADEEHVAGHFGTSLTQILRDNRWLTGWLAEYTK